MFVVQSLLHLPLNSHFIHSELLRVTVLPTMQQNRGDGAAYMALQMRVKWDRAAYVPAAQHGHLEVIKLATLMDVE